MELWDLRTPSGRILPQTRPRGQSLPPGTTHAILGVWTLHRATGRILTTRRAPHKHPYPNTWENTGGAVRAGESPITAAAREVREETGLPCQPQDLLCLGRLATPLALAYVFVYLYDGDPQAVRIQAEEISDYAWTTPQDLRALMKSGIFMPPEVYQYRAFQEDILAYFSL